MNATIEAGLVAGIDPHKQTLTVTILDERGGVLGTESFNVSGTGHRAMLAWAAGIGQVRVWGVEGASGLGRHTAVFLGRAQADVREVCPTRTAEQARRRRQGKTDNLDAERIAREVQAHPDLPAAFKRASGDIGPDPIHDQMALLHKARRSLLKTRQHVLNEAEAILIAPPEHLKAALGRDDDQRHRLKRLASLDRVGVDVPIVALRLELVDQASADITNLDGCDKTITARLRQLVDTQDSTFSVLCGISTKSAVELLVETGDPRRFTERGLNRSTAPHPSRHPQAKAPANRSVTASIKAATGRSTQCSTAWPSNSFAATRSPRSVRARALTWAHQARGHAHPQAPPLQRCPPHHGPRHPPQRPCRGTSRSSLT